MIVSTEKPPFSMLRMICSLLSIRPSLRPMFRYFSVTSHSSFPPSFYLFPLDVLDERHEVLCAAVDEVVEDRFAELVAAGDLGHLGERGVGDAELELRDRGLGVRGDDELGEIGDVVEAVDVLVELEDGLVDVVVVVVELHEQAAVIVVREHEAEREDLEHPVERLRVDVDVVAGDVFVAVHLHRGLLGGDAEARIHAEEADLPLVHVPVVRERHLEHGEEIAVVVLEHGLGEVRLRPVGVFVRDELALVERDGKRRQRLDVRERLFARLVGIGEVPHGALVVARQPHHEVVEDVVFGFQRAADLPPEKAFFLVGQEDRLAQDELVFAHRLGELRVLFAGAADVRLDEVPRFALRQPHVRSAEAADHRSLHRLERELVVAAHRAVAVEAVLLRVVIEKLVEVVASVVGVRVRVHGPEDREGRDAHQARVGRLGGDEGAPRGLDGVVAAALDDGEFRFVHRGSPFVGIARLGAARVITSIHQNARAVPQDFGETARRLIFWVYNKCWSVHPTGGVVY